MGSEMCIRDRGVTQGLVKLDLLSHIRQEIKGRVMSELHKDFQLTSARLGDSAGLAGLPRWSGTS